MKAADSYLEEGRAFNSLTIRDLLEARDAYHVFLSRKQNVIGTAIAKYRMRREGIDDDAPKTLASTEIRPYSWPCVLVFVRQWVSAEAFGRRGILPNDEFLPPRLHLPDGREIPVCVIEAAWQPRGERTMAPVRFPGSLVGGGYPILTRVQGEDRWATLGCLVSDGRITYGLTNSHVAGRPGESILTIGNGNERKIGVSSRKLLHKLPFSTVYDTFPGRHSFVNLDIGLIELGNLQGVTSQVYGIGELRGIADVNHDTLSLKLVGCPVRGYGCASGDMRGEIICLFYRYGTSGGYDYVADYLIGPRTGAGSPGRPTFSPGYGDSGTLLLVDDPESEERQKAIAVLWGGQRDGSGTLEQPYGLATNLGTICRLLDVELVCDWNTGYDTYFGSYAHLVLPSLCASLIEDDSLRALMENNAAHISLPLASTAVKQTHGLSTGTFVPLADVPDLVWKKRGGSFQRGREGANHFADMDQRNPADNRTLLELCEDPENIEPDVWSGFYKAVKAKQKGALPFRIAQVFDEMVEAATGGSAERFIGAAGILTHYVLDASMPLHISYLHHGDPYGPKAPPKKGEEDGGKPLAYNIHDEFDNAMVEYRMKDLKKSLPGLVKTKFASAPGAAGEIRTAKDAARAAVALMRKTVELVSPASVVRDYEQLLEMAKKERCERLWQTYGEGYQDAMAEGVVLIARLWEAAWMQGKGEDHIQQADAVDPKELKRLYQSPDFLESVNLEDIRGTMTW